MPLRSWKPRRKKREPEAQPAPGLQAPSPEERESGAQTSRGRRSLAPRPRWPPASSLVTRAPRGPLSSSPPDSLSRLSQEPGQQAPRPPATATDWFRQRGGLPRTRWRSFVYCHTQSAVTRGKNARLMTIESYLRLAELSAGEERSREGARDIEGFSWEARS